MAGIGPNQSRNMVQLPWLTRFEIPLDSRFMKWFQMVEVLRTDNVKALACAISYPKVYKMLLDRVEDFALSIEIL